MIPGIAEPARWILLTGAGFSANFGGFLARDMWQRLFNRLSILEELKTLLLDDLDFESAYEKALMGSISENSRKAFSLALFETYREMDDSLRGWRWGPGSAYPVNEYAIRNLISRFAGIRYKESGYFFTLNQDLFVELTYAVLAPDRNPMIIPGIDHAGLPLFSTNFRQQVVPDERFMRVMKNPRERVSGMRSAFFYVKLHGSYGWDGPDDRLPMLIGRRKADGIQGNELFEWYFETFERVLTSGDRKLLVCGYGFRDDHVNALVARAVRDSRLRIALMYHTRPDDVLGYLKTNDDGRLILRGLENIYTTPFSVMYPASQDRTEADRVFQTEFFGNVSFVT